MKRCPECRRDYYDDTLLYCLDDGNALLEDPATASSGDEPATLAQLQANEPPARSGPEHADDGFWVAVLPFKSSGADLEVSTLAEGLSEDIVTGLSRFSYLRVIARGSTVCYADQAIDIRTVGKELVPRAKTHGAGRLELTTDKISL